MHHNSIINFSAGPSKLPLEVLKKAQEELISYQNVGYSILEMSHRSAEFSKIANESESYLRDLLNIPDNYKIIFLQGGASGQFSAVPMNLINRSSKKSADYIVTGFWSGKAATEAVKYGTVKEVFPRLSSFTSIPDKKEWNLDPEASYVYYCANETIHGVEFQDVIEAPPGVPIVCDMSSNILSREISISKFGLIFASAQKNMGCAGVTIVIVRDDLLNDALVQTPTVFNYKVLAGMNSLYNTPPTFPIYMAKLTFQWLKEQGGLKYIEGINFTKATTLYNFIDTSDGFYRCPVNKTDRSMVNVVFRVQDGDEDQENALIVFAKSKYNIIEIKGHRLIGGLRISLYNSIPLEYVQILIECLTDFKENSFKNTPIEK